MILITGARGFIGSGLAAFLKNTGREILPLSRSETFELKKDHIFLDLTTPKHLKRLADSGVRPDTVIHLAGHIEISLKANADDPQRAPVPGPENLAAIYSSNVLATTNIIDYCRQAGVRHLVFASSQTVYGMPPDEHITEETPTNPLEHYALSKECCEKVLRLCATDDFAVTVLRFPGVYSENRRSGAVYRFCESAKKDRKVRVTSDIPLPYDVIHIDDVTSAISCAIGAKHRGFDVYNIGTGEPCSLDILADRIAALVPGCTAEHAAVPQPVIRMDSGKARRELGWKAAPTVFRLQQVLDSINHD